MTRAGAIGIACAMGVLPVTTGQMAQAARPQTLATARVAAILARIVRQDARQQEKRSRPTLTVTEGCCGQRTLRIHYVARSQSPVVHDNYVLLLETKRGVLRGMAISESISEVESLGADSQRIGDWSYELAVHQQSSRRAGWRYTISCGGKGSTIRPPAWRAIHGRGVLPRVRAAKSSASRAVSRNAARFQQGSASHLVGGCNPIAVLLLAHLPVAPNAKRPVESAYTDARLKSGSIPD